MDIKARLKEKLLEIPIRSMAYREKHRLADDLEVESKDIELLLNELCSKNILTEKIEYICPNCRDTTVLDSELLKEMTEEGEDDKFECDNCGDLINPKVNTKRIEITLGMYKGDKGIIKDYKTIGVGVIQYNISLDNDSSNSYFYEDEFKIIK